MNPSPSAFNFGGVFGATFGVIRRNPVPLLAAALAYGLVSALIGMMGQIWTADQHFGLYKSFGVNEAISIGSSVIVSLFNFAAVPVVMADAQGERATIGEALSAPLKVLLPAIGLAVLTQLGITLGFMLLVVPGVILALMWSVAVPAMFVERLGAFDALRRSGILTENHRWSILGLMIVLGLITIGVEMVIALPTGGAVPTGPDRYMWGVLRSVVTALGNTIFATAVSQTYLELRRLKGGLSGETAKVFD